FPSSKNAPREPCERDRRIAELGEVIHLQLILRTPKGIKQTDKRGSLSEVIVQIEQLKTAQAGRAQICFDLLLVAFELKSSGRVGERFVLLEQSVRFHRVAKDLV